MKALEWKLGSSTLTSLLHLLICEVSNSTVGKDVDILVKHCRGSESCESCLRYEAMSEDYTGHCSFAGNKHFHSNFLLFFKINCYTYLKN